MQSECFFNFINLYFYVFRFAHLFVDAQKHLSDLKEQRRGMYKQLASDILTGVVKMMDKKFADLDKR